MILLLAVGHARTLLRKISKSIAYLHNWIFLHSLTLFFVGKVGQYCGNNEVEKNVKDPSKSEECDPGLDAKLNSSLTDKCCDDNCKLKIGASCRYHFFHHCAQNTNSALSPSEVASKSRTKIREFVLNQGKREGVSKKSGKVREVLRALCCFRAMTFSLLNDTSTWVWQSSNFFLMKQSHVFHETK